MPCKFTLRAPFPSPLTVYRRGDKRTVGHRHLLVAQRHELRAGDLARLYLCQSVRSSAVSGPIVAPVRIGVAERAHPPPPIEQRKQVTQRWHSRAALPWSHPLWIAASFRQIITGFPAGRAVYFHGIKDIAAHRPDPVGSKWMKWKKPARPGGIRLTWTMRR